jgi:outer membrane protein insertion porin family
LFDGELPLSGRLPEEVSDVLQAMLVEKSIPGHVEYERVGKSDGPVLTILYRVADVLIQIRDVEFVGAGEAELPALTAASKRVFEREYSRTVLRSLIEKQLLPVYYSRGYLKASFGDPQPKVVKQPSASNDEGPRNLTIVDVLFPVTPGQQYKLKSLQWSGNEAIPTDTLAKMVRLEPGQAANMVRLGDSLSEIQKLYGSKGFVTASITPQPSFDETAGSVAITLEVKEGPVFHMGDLEFRGLDNGLTAKLRNAWKIRPGEVYNSTYLSEYLPAAQRLLPPTLDWEVSPHVTANVKDKTVDVDLIYSAKAPK